jgi:Arc/MetJ family transcription regulator
MLKPSGKENHLTHTYIHNKIQRTNVVLDNNLIDEAFKCAENIHTKKELIETALKEFVRNRKQKNLRDLKGKILFSENYDYKKMRH